MNVGDCVLTTFGTGFFECFFAGGVIVALDGHGRSWMKEESIVMVTT